MFENLTERLSKTVNTLRGRGKLTEDNIKEALRDVRVALLEADVALPVVKNFIDKVRDRAIGQEVLTALKPGQALIKVVQDELIQVMGEGSRELNLASQPPAVILVAGLQGAGKTTTIGKIARYLKLEKKKKVMVVSCDVYRPAAIKQLETLAGQVQVKFQHSDPSMQPAEIARNAIVEAKRQFMDVLLVDTAGRMHVDDVMMGEIKELHRVVQPTETLFVVDSMTGQDAANTARSFGDALPLTGVVLTKTDGDARGGAALSVRQVTGVPILFMGEGEKLEDLERFYPDRVASRILGMGDMLSLIEEVERKVDKKKTEKLAKKVSKGQRFTLLDYRDQLEQMQNMGGMGGMMDKLPGMGNIPDHVKNKVGDKQTNMHMAIIGSMTPQERKFPDVIRGSRKKRIAKGSGTSIQDVNRLLKQFSQMQKMMKKFAKGGMSKMMNKLKGRLPPGGMPGGGMPPGGMPF
ncbi:MAG: signal recognition particle protein [bacterium]